MNAIPPKPPIPPTTERDRPAHRPAVIAHRGASAYAPENTLAAFRLARELGADWFELDCRLTRDGQVVVIHDDSLSRTTDGRGLVITQTLAQLRRLDAGAWKDPQFAGERIPTLEEALCFAKDGIGVYIEIKDCADDRPFVLRLLDMARSAGSLRGAQAKDVMRLYAASGSVNFGLTRKALALVRRLGMEQQVVVQSFSPIIILMALIEAPEVRAELLGEDIPSRPGAWREYEHWGELLDPAGMNINARAVTAARLARFHDAGRTVAVWTVDEESEMVRLANLGVDALITNRPDLALQVARSAEQREQAG